MPQSPGSPDVAGMVSDPDFLKLSPTDKRTALTRLTGDQSFNQLSDGDTLQFVSRLTGKPMPTESASVPRPQFPIFPQDGESFADTMKRGAIAGRSVTPAQIQANAQQGIKDAPLVLGAAAGAGIAGPAALALPGELGSIGATVVGAGAKAAIPYVTKIGQWANANPVKAYLALQALKDLVPGFKKATETVKKSQ